MNDTLSVKPILPAQIGVSQLDATARDFSRAAAVDKTSHVRVNTALGSLNPTFIRISHQMPTNKSTLQRSLLEVRQQLSRVDALGNVLSVVTPSFKIVFEIPSGVTEAEAAAVQNLCIGALMANTGALGTQIREGQF